MSYDVAMASWLKNQNKGFLTAGYYIGTVVSVSPLSISFLDGKGFAKGDFLEISERIQELMQSEKPLKVGDKIILIGHKKFCAIDRLGGA